jgi:hypothetical protein
MEYTENIHIRSTDPIYRASLLLLSLKLASSVQLDSGPASSSLDYLMAHGQLHPPLARPVAGLVDNSASK